MPGKTKQVNQTRRRQIKRRYEPRKLGGPYLSFEVREAIRRWNEGIPALLAENLRKVIARERRKDKPEPEDDGQ
jgi:hypothetical protein